MTCSTAITPDSPKTDSLIIVDKHLDTILETESNEFITSTTNFLTFSNPLFDDSTSSDDESGHEEVIHEMNFKTYSNPLFDLDEEINSSEFNSTNNEDLYSTPKDVRFDAESYLLESLVNRDTLMASPPNINFILDEFAEGDILFLESLLYDNSSPRPSEAYQANSNTIIKSLPISVDALREEIDILHGPDDAIPPDSTIDVVEDILVDVPNILAPHPTLLMDFDFIPSNDLGSDLDVSSPSGDRNKIYDPGICIEVESTRFLAPLSPVIDTLLPFSSENEDKVFNHGVLASKEKSPPSSSHRGFKASKLFHHKSPMLTHGDNTPNLGDFPDCDDSRARGFCPSFTRASNPQLHFGNPISKSYRLTFIFKHT
ncbi:hypothetical protein Tco_0251398 [Tanacetum coccineum]